jgi:hypothetical protein
MPCIRGFSKVLWSHTNAVSETSIRDYLGELDQVCEDLLKKFGHWECSSSVGELRDEAERLAWASYSTALAKGNSDLPRAAPENSSERVQFPQRAEWLQREMKDRDSMTPYQLHKQGGPDPKTIKKVLAGKRVHEPKLELIAMGLSHGGRRVSREDIPNN